MPSQPSDPPTGWRDRSRWLVLALPLVAAIELALSLWQAIRR